MTTHADEPPENEPRSEQRQSNYPKQLGGVTGKGFMPGKSGNPLGRPSNAEAREFARRLIDDEAYQDNVRKRILKGDANHLETLLWHYLYGKPADTVNLKVPRQTTFEGPDDDLPADDAA